MDSKLLTAFQQIFGGSLSNMKFLTDEELTLQQLSAVLSLAHQALQDAIIATKLRNSMDEGNEHYPGNSKNLEQT